MMRWTGRIAVATLMMSTSAQAHAADWWWVAGEPGGSAAFFVDADTVMKDDGAVTFRMQRVLRDGRADEANERMPCDTALATPEDEAMRRFACATAEERMDFALMTGPMTPLETARLIFSMPERTPGAQDGKRVAGR